MILKAVWRGWGRLERGVAAGSTGLWRAWRWVGRGLLAGYRRVDALEHRSRKLGMTPGAVMGLVVVLAMGVVIGIGWLLVDLVLWTPVLGVPVMVIVAVLITLSLLGFEADIESMDLRDWEDDATP